MQPYSQQVGVVRAAAEQLLAVADLSPGSSAAGILESISTFTPILNLGLGGLLVFLIVRRIGIEPTYVYKDAKIAWDRERTELLTRFDAERDTWTTDRARIEVERDRERVKADKDIDELQAANKQLTTTIVEQVVPAVTRVSAPLLDLVRLKEQEQRRDEERRTNERRAGGGSNGAR